jgi:hypothetical protein
MTFKGYKAVMNIGANGRGTAVIHRDSMQIESTRRLPSGRGVVVNLDNVTIVNIYAPSGTARRAEREEFFNTEIIELLPVSPRKLILAGDFNCIIGDSESTDKLTHCRALGRLIQGLHLRDAWDKTVNPQGYTHYTAKGAARLDRIYLTEDLHKNKQGIETKVTVFADHLAVLLRITLDTPFILRGKGRWSMNTSLLNDTHFQKKFEEEWEGWTRHINRYQDIQKWWSEYAKKKIQILFKREGAERNADRRQLEDYYYTVMNEVICGTGQPEEKMTKLKHLKAKIVRLNSVYRRVMIDTADKDAYGDETPSLHQLLANRRRKENRLIWETCDHNGVKKTTSTAILKMFMQHLQTELQEMEVSKEHIDITLECDIRRIDNEFNDQITAPFTEEELWEAINQGKTKKAPGPDGIGLEFYKTQWNIIKVELLQVFNRMFSEEPIPAQQVKGLVVCIPKEKNPTCIDDYRPLTLLNADHKILARMIANTMKVALKDTIHQHQHCGLPGSSIFDALANIRDAIAYAETTKKPLCLLSLDFKASFDRISHRYLRETLKAHGFGEAFIRRIMGMYQNATSVLQINGFISGSFDIKRSIRQGCPLSMILYVLCINPLIHKLEERITGIKLGGKGNGTSTITYADDVTILMTDQNEIQTLQEIITGYEKATGSLINMKKSKTLPIGGWDTTRKIMDIE